MKRVALFLLVALIGGFVVAPLSRAGASDADGTYEIPVWFRWEESLLDVIVVPPNHGQIVNGNGVLAGGDPDELTPFNSYLAAIEASISDWDAGINMFGPEWLRSALVTNVYVAGRDTIPNSVLGDPEIVITTDETKANTLGLAVSSRPCLVDNSKIWTQSFTYEDMYNINSQEYGHCLGLDHVVENHPEHDAMAGTYVDGVGVKGGHLHCVSNLDVLGLTSVFGGLFDKPSPDMVSVPVDQYGTTCSPPTGGGGTTPTPTPSDATVGPAPSPTATSTPEPSPSATPTPPPADERSLTLRLRRHLQAVGRVEEAGAAECYAGVPVEIEKRTRAGWRTVASSSTGDDGSFSIRLMDRAGNYRAVAPAITRDQVSCPRATSVRRSHGH